MESRTTTEGLGEVLARDCPDYATGTLVLRDEGGHLVGYGRLRRTGETTVEVTTSSGPLASLSPPSQPQPSGA
jgi:hypothetical protein